MVINGKIASLKFWIVKSFYRVRNQKPWNLQLWPQLKSGCDDQLNKANFRRCYLIILKRESLLQQTNTLWKLPISANSRFLWGSGVPILLIITKKIPLYFNRYPPYVHNCSLWTRAYYFAVTESNFMFQVQGVSKLLIHVLILTLQVWGGGHILEVYLILTLLLLF